MNRIDFGGRLPQGRAAKMLRLRPAYRNLSEADCSERQAACHQRCSDLRPSLSPGATSLAEREEIALLKVQGHSIREIGRRFGTGCFWSFEPVWLGDATGRGAEPSTQRSVLSRCMSDAVSLT
ncbi:helix-turn-helix domain-containing protein [Bradyrhizobium sp. CIR3A]|uniref:helix-turn-helix domain-containing protein n=1 Tax=Bradyrhizobium sp. CIR3A TaxID=2663838 RepID=UPI00390CA34C